MGDATGREADEDLVELFQTGRDDGRRRAFCALYERHAGTVRSYLLRLTGRPHLADDLTQDAFLRALNALDRFSGKSTFKTWVFKIAMNLFRDHLRGRRTATGAAPPVEDSPDRGPGPDELAQRNEDAQRVRDAVAALPEEQRAPLILVRFEGMKYREAAEALGITLGAVRMRVHRAHLALVAGLTTCPGLSEEA